MFDITRQHGQNSKVSLANPGSTDFYSYVNWIVGRNVGWMGAYYNFAKVIEQMENKLGPRKVTES